MDKRSIVVIILLALLVIFWSPIMISLGLLEPAPQSPTPEQAIGDTASPDQSVTEIPGPQTLPADEQTPAGILTAIPRKAADRAAPAQQVDTITVETGKYTILLSTFGGGPVSIKLKEYSYPWKGNGPVEMLPGARTAEPKLIFQNGQFDITRLHYASEQSGTINVQGSSRTITFTFMRADGAAIQKIYTFYPDKYSFDLKIIIPDRRQFNIERHYQLAWRNGLTATELDEKGDYAASFAMGLLPGESFMLGEDGFFGGDWENDTTFAREIFDITWLGKRSKYFTAIMIPRSGPGSAAEISGKKSRVKDHQNETIEKKTLSISITIPITDTDGRLEDNMTFYVGPLDWDRMKSYDIELEEMFDIGTTPFVGWMIRIFAIPIMWLLPRMYDIIPNYGVIIILLGVMVKVVTWPLSRKTVKSMAGMRELQPKIEKLKEKHKKNPQAQQKAMMALYKEAGVNPLGGCLPMLPQMPLFIALFRVFNTTILLRGAPFTLWIDDLSRGALSWTDPYTVLVVIMALLMFFQQKVSMTDPRNKAMVYIMPVVFGFMFHSFSSGLVLYWTTFSAFSLVEQYIGNRKRTRENRQIT